MKKYISILKKSRLFAGVGEADIEAMLDCLSAKLRGYKKGEYVLREGEHIDNVMVLASGSLNIQKDDFWGNRSIINHISAGEMFGEAYIAPESGPDSQ